MYNNQYSGYSPFNFGIELEERKKKQRHTFSLLFLALFIYLLSFNVITIAIYLLAPLVLGRDTALQLLDNPIADVLLSSAVQYLIAFPIFLLITCRIQKAEKKQKKNLSGAEIFMMFAVAEALMFAGNLIGTMLNNIIGSYIGHIPENGVESTVTVTPMWLVFIVMVILAPIFEELVFRKVLIDRLAVYGDLPAILFSAVAFGLMHGNLYQLFYATMLGVLLGYIYTNTRQVKYTILIHMLINFFGSVVALPIQEAFSVFTEQLNAYMGGFPYDTLKLAVSGIITMLYTTFQYGLFIAGGLVVIYRLIRKEIKVSTDREIYLSGKDLAKGGIVNAGSILFISLTVFFMIISLF